MFGNWRVNKKRARRCIVTGSGTRSDPVVSARVAELSDFSTSEFVAPRSCYGVSPGVERSLYAYHRRERRGARAAAESTSEPIKNYF